MPPVSASQRDRHAATQAAQWWAGSSLLPPSVARGVRAHARRFFFRKGVRLTRIDPFEEIWFPTSHFLNVSKVPARPPRATRDGRWE